MPTYYAYIDEAGDEGLPTPYTDVTKYRDRAATQGGRSPFFLLCAALVEDSKRSATQKAIRALANRLYPNDPDKSLHWRELSWERKEQSAKVIATLDFCWVVIVAYKPMMKKALPPPKMYNYLTKILLERLCLEVHSYGGTLRPVFSNRARTDYDELEDYVSREVRPYGGAEKCLSLIETNQHRKERLLQLADMCAGAVENALEVNSFGNLQTTFLKSTIKRIRRSAGRKLWGYGFKIYPSEKGTNYGPPTAWIDLLRTK